MRKILIILMLAFLLSGFVYADEHAEINGIDFEIPSKYQEGEMNHGDYKTDNIFSIRCIDDNIVDAIGLWASEQEFSEDVEISNHPVRHFCQYNKYVDGNHSHAYFASGESVYEISWAGKEIDEDIEKLINDTPDSKINSDEFYSELDTSLELYKIEKVDKLNRDSEYNNLESRYHSLYDKEKTNDDTRFKEILYAYYLN